MRLSQSVFFIAGAAGTSNFTRAGATDDNPLLARENFVRHLVRFEGARLQRLLKKSEPQIPRGLKPARDDKNKELNGAPKGTPFQSTR
jgi:hypothetical protein